MNILHLSDIHYRVDIKDFDKYVKKPLLKSLESYKEKIDLVIISGDLLDKGGNGSNYSSTFDEFYLFLIEISYSINISIENFIITPGNHDICRTLDKEYTENGIASEIRKKASFVNEFIENNYDTNINEGLKRIEPFIKCYKEFNKKNGNLIHSSNFDCVSEYKIKDQKIVVVSLNSSWRCYGKNDNESIQLGMTQLDSAISQIKDSDFRIITMHHHHDFFKSNDDYYEILKKITENFDLACYGHVHDNDSELSIRSNDAIYISVCPSMNVDYYKENSFNRSNGYRILSINLKNEPRELKVEYFSYRKSYNDFHYNTAITKNNTGVEIYKYPSSEEMIVKASFRDLVHTHKELREEIVNNNLLSAVDFTKAPKTIREIFVAPNLYYFDDSDEKENIKIEDIIMQKEDYYIFGKRESGKSLLLNRIYLEICENFSKYNKIPIFINFSDLSEKSQVSMSSYLRQLLKISLNKYNLLKKDADVIFIFDNVQFGEKSKYFKLVTEIKNEFSCCKFIITSITSLSGEIPIEFHKSDLSNIKIVKIGHFDSNKVRELTVKWYCNNTDYYDCNKEDIIDNIVNIIKKMGIENNPLSISMFLMIFEQNQNYNRLNYATIIEKFVEKCLEKNAEKNTFRFQFDFKNTESLLAIIAVKCCRLSTNKYGIKTSEFMEETNAYLKRTSRWSAYKSSDIFSMLTQSKIVIEEIFEDDYITFRYNCVYFYYLMKRMTFNDEFRNEVLSKEKILDYISVVDLYTSSNRTKDDVLKIILDLYKDVFEPVIGNIMKTFNSFDTMFRVNDEENEFVLSNSEEIIKKIKQEKLEKNKIKQEKLEKIRNEVLCSDSCEGEIDRYSEIEKCMLGKMERIMVLMSYVVRNLEDCEDQDVLIQGTQSAIKASLVFASIYRLIIIEALKSKEIVETIDTNLIKKYLNLFPMFNQIIISSHLHSPQIIDISETILKDTSDRISNIEKFTYLFSMFDCNIKLMNNENMRKQILQLSESYLISNIQIKLFDYYYETENKSIEELLLNLIADLNPEIKSEKRLKKGAYIEDLKKQKLLLEFK